MFVCPQLSLYDLVKAFVFLAAPFNIILLLHGEIFDYLQTGSIGNDTCWMQVKVQRLANGISYLWGDELF